MITTTAELAVLQGIRLKGGLADLHSLAVITGLDSATAENLVADLVRGEFVADHRGRFRITPEGRARLDAGLAAERDGLDAERVHAAHDAFTPLNGEFKTLVHDWQLRDGIANDHTDGSYDAAVLGRLDDLDLRFRPVVSSLVVLAPRLAAYPHRFDIALGKVRAGDHRYLLSPILDSYHQVWFELHEDLLGLAGLERLAEASAGRAE